MPLTDFQKKVLLLLRQHRNPNSYIGGGAAIHRGQHSLRLSRDVDFFHDTDEAVAESSRADISLLEEKHYQVKKIIDQPSFIRAVVSKDSQSLKLEWVRDTAFRFFPVLEDEQLGYRLHDVDLAVNKCLALANRNEVRDILDLMELHQNVISLPAACWAACGKDPGFTPEFLLDCMRRNSIIRPEQLAAESLTRQISAIELKTAWLELMAAAGKDIETFPPADLGCIYVTAAGETVRMPKGDRLQDKRRHFGSVGGCWPCII